MMMCVCIYIYIKHICLVMLNKGSSKQIPLKQNKKAFNRQSETF